MDCDELSIFAEFIRPQPIKKTEKEDKEQLKIKLSIKPEGKKERIQTFDACLGNCWRVTNS